MAAGAVFDFYFYYQISSAVEPELLAALSFVENALRPRAFLLQRENLRIWRGPEILFEWIWDRQRVLGCVRCFGFACESRAKFCNLLLN